MGIALTGDGRGNLTGGLMRPKINHLLAALVALTLMGCAKKEENRTGATASTVNLSETEAVDRLNRLFTRPAAEAGKPPVSIELIAVNEGDEAKPEATRLTMKPIAKNEEGKFQFASSLKVNQKNDDPAAPPADSIDVKQTFQSKLDLGQDGKLQLTRLGSAKDLSVFHVQGIGSEGVKLVPVAAFPYLSDRKSHQTMHDVDVRIEEATLDAEGKTRYTITMKTYEVSNQLADALIVMDRGTPSLDPEGKRRFNGIPLKNFRELSDQKQLTKVAESKQEWVQVTP